MVIPIEKTAQAEFAIAVTQIKAKTARTIIVMINTINEVKPPANLPTSS